MKIFENDFLLIRKHPTNGRLYTEWLRNASTDEFREGVLLFLDLIVGEGIELWVIDASKLHGIRIADQQWILTKIVPGIHQSNLRKIARIGSGDIFQYMTFEELIGKALHATGAQIEVAQFTSLSMAEAWIMLNE